MPDNLVVVFLLVTVNYIYPTKTYGTIFIIHRSAVAIYNFLGRRVIYL